MRLIVIVLTTCTCFVSSLPPPHPDVVALRQEEELLHPSLRSPALRNPRLLKILPLTSLLHEGENLVFHREASNVSREQIYKILTHAGLIPRRFWHKSSVPVFSTSDHDEISTLLLEDHAGLHESLLANQDILQHL